MSGDRHDVLFDGSHPLPSNYRAYRDSVHSSAGPVASTESGVPFSRDWRRTELGGGSGPMWVWTSNMSAPDAGAIWRRPASPIETSPFWEIRQEPICST